MLDEILTATFITGLLAAAVRMATPILLTALGEIYTELSGILNIGIEGTMLAGCLAGFIGTYYTGSIFCGILWGIITGGLMGLIMGILSITLQANQVACGIILKLLSLGMTSFIFRVVFGVTILPPNIKTLTPLPLPIINKIPFVGQILFQQNLMVYITFLLVLLSSFLIFKTGWGLKIRAVGEYPLAADTMGINVYNIRYICVIAGGMLAGMGGTFLAMDLGMFVDNMIAGRGFIALASVIFGRWKPHGVMAGALIFGLADAFQLRLQALGYNFPHEVLLMLPYVLTIIILTGILGKSHAPAALTQPYIKEK